MLFMATVALMYTPLAPLVPVGAAAVFWISGIVYKYQLMFVFTTKVESGGVCPICVVSNKPVPLTSGFTATVEYCHQPTSLLYHVHAGSDDP